MFGRVFCWRGLEPNTPRLSPDQSILVRGRWNDSPSLIVTDLISNRPDAILNTTNFVNSIRFGPDSTWFAIGSYQSTVQIWGYDMNGDGIADDFDGDGDSKFCWALMRLGINCNVELVIFTFISASIIALIALSYRSRH